MENWYTPIEQGPVEGTPFIAIGRIELLGAQQKYDCQVLIKAVDRQYFIVHGWNQQTKRFSLFWTIEGDFIEHNTKERIIESINSWVDLWERYQER